MQDLFRTDAVIPSLSACVEHQSNNLWHVHKNKFRTMFPDCINCLNVSECGTFTSEQGSRAEAAWNVFRVAFSLLITHGDGRKSRRVELPGCRFQQDALLTLMALGRWKRILGRTGRRTSSRCLCCRDVLFQLPFSYRPGSWERLPPRARPGTGSSPWCREWPICLCLRSFGWTEEFGSSVILFFTLMDPTDDFNRWQGS